MQLLFRASTPLKMFLSKVPLFMLGGTFVLLGLFIPKIWGEGWYASMNILLIYTTLFIAIYFLFDKKTKLYFTWFDWIFLIFVGWHFLSFFWATNASLIWAKSSSWLFIFCFYQIVRCLDFKKIKIENYCKIFLLVNLFNYIVLSWFFFELATGGGTFGFSFKDLNKANSYIGRNGNYIASVLVVLFPCYFIVYHFLKKWQWPILAMLSIHLVFLVSFNSRGAVLALLVQLIMAAIFFINRAKLKKVLTTALLGGGMLLLFSLLINNKTEFLNKYNPLYNVQTSYGDDRLDMWHSSLKLFLENPLLGKGCGNWFLEYPKYGLGQFNFSFDTYNYFEHPHNQYMHILSELGIVGLALFLFIAFYFLFVYLKKIRLEPTNVFYFAIVSILLNYLIVASFYGVVYTERYILAFPQLALFFSFAVANRVIEEKNNKQNTFLKLIVLLLILLYLGFYYQNRKFQTDYVTFNFYKKKEDYKKALEKVQSIYDPMFYTIVPHGRKVAIKTYEALAFWKYEKKEEAIATMYLALEDQPWSHENWFHLGNMYRRIKDWENAIICYENTYALHNRFFKAQLNLAEINLAQNNLEEARKWYTLGNDVIAPIIEMSENADEEKKRKRAKSTYEKFKSYEKRFREIENKIKEKVRISPK